MFWLSQSLKMNRCIKSIIQTYLKPKSSNHHYNNLVSASTTLTTKGNGVAIKAKEALEANNKVCNHMYTFIYSMSLKCAVELGIPEAIHRHGKPISLPELASALPVNPNKARFLPKLLQLLAKAGYFTEHYDYEQGRTGVSYSLTAASETLLKDHPYSIRPYLLAMLDPNLVRTWNHLSGWFGNGDQSPFTSANGVTMWEYAGKDAEFNRNFNESMASDSRLSADVLVRSPEWAGLFDGVGSLVDVGGGTGEMARAVAEVYPHIECSVLDLPHVISGLHGTPNLSFVAGDMCQAIPPADVVLLKRILHDWDDEDALKILKQCRNAVTSNASGRRGKVMIIDMVLDDENMGSRDRETQQFYSIQMMILLGGKERNESEWRKLFEDAGFTGGYKIHPALGLRPLIEVYP